jgi:hypothetical protein
VRLLRTILHEEERESIKSVDFQASCLTDAPFQRRNAFYLAKNAGCLKALPFLQVDESLLPFVNSLAIQESKITYLMKLAEKIVSGGGDDFVNPFTEGYDVRLAIETLLSGFDDDVQEGTAVDNNDNNKDHEKPSW